MRKDSPPTRPFRLMARWLSPALQVVPHKNNLHFFVSDETLVGRRPDALGDGAKLRDAERPAFVSGLRARGGDPGFDRIPVGFPDFDNVVLAYQYRWGGR